MEHVNSNLLKKKTIQMFICFKALWLDKAQDFQGLGFCCCWFWFCLCFGFVCSYFAWHIVFLFLKKIVCF